MPDFFPLRYSEVGRDYLSLRKYAVAFCFALFAIFCSSIVLLLIRKNFGVITSPSLQLCLGMFPLSIAAPLAALGYLLFSSSPRQWQKILDLRFELYVKDHKVLKQNLKLLALIIPVVFLLNGLTTLLLKNCGFEHLPTQDLFIPKAGSPLSLWVLIFVSTIFLAPISEEFIFRLLLFHSSDFLRIPLPEFFTAFVFALMHQIPQAIPSLFFLGVILQKQKEKDGLLASIMLHSCYNLLMFGGLVFMNLFFAK